MKVRRKSLAWLSALALMLGLVGGIGPAVKADDDYQLWVGEVKVTAANKGDIDGTGTASYDPESNTLTLNNYVYNGGGSENPDYLNSYCGIYYKGDADFTIDLKGNNSITITKNGKITYGIRTCLSNVSIQGEGSLYVESQGGIDTNYGIYHNASGLRILSLNADITVKATSDDSDGTAIMANYLNILGGQIKAVAKGANNNSGEATAIGAYDNLSVSGGIIEAIGQDSGGLCFGLYSQNGNISINGETNVKAVAGKSIRNDGASIGIYAVRGNVSIGGKAKVTTKADQAVSGFSYGIAYAEDGDRTLTIGPDVEMIEAFGYGAATNYKVKNSVVGLGWNDISGTGDPEKLSVNTIGQTLNYKVLNFPYPRQKVTKAPVSQTNLVATGGPIQLIDPGTAPAGMLYAVERDTTAQYAGQYLATTTRQAPSEDKFTEDIPTATNPGTYYVWYMAKGDDVHRNSEPQMLEVTITAASNPEPDPTPDTPEAAPDTPEEKETTVTKVPLTGDKTIFSWLW